MQQYHPEPIEVGVMDDRGRGRRRNAKVTPSFSSPSLDGLGVLILLEAGTALPRYCHPSAGTSRIQPPPNNAQCSLHTLSVSEDVQI